METMVYDIADLFGECEVARDETGSLVSIARFLEDCDPLFMLLADANGNVIAAENLGGEVLQQEPDRLAVKLMEGLTDCDSYSMEIPFGNEFLLAFAIRLSAHVKESILGGIVRHCEVFEKRLPKMQNQLATFGELAWKAIYVKSCNATLRTRLQHLVNEQDTLKGSHARAVSHALEEHEERLREQQEHMAHLERLHLQNKMILNSAGEGIFGMDRDGRITFVNPAGATMLGWEPEKLVGHLQHQLIRLTKGNGQPYTAEECPIQATLCDGTVSDADNEFFWRKDGTSFSVEYTNTPIREGQDIIGAVLTFRDTTERKALERQLAQSQKLESIGQLAAGIAHEINTPTQYIGDNTRFFQESLGELSTVLSGFDRLLEAAKEHVVTDDLVAEVQAAIDDADLDYLTEEMLKAVEQSLEGVSRVATIVRSMKEFSHPGTDEKQFVDLNRAIENTLTVSRNEWRYIADAVTKLDPALPPVSCLPGECNQVFLNLIINASHAIADRLENDPSEKGIITIGTRHDGDWAEVRVQDNGTGIPEAVRSRVLDPFFTTKEVGRGTGQGLAMAHSVIVEKHGGTLVFETEIGKGTSFIIRLPIDQISCIQKDIEK